jgi:dipeptidyl aminopeptidase/acylaminoacyl peptidase
MSAFATQRDLRASPLYREIEALIQDLRRAGTGQISDAADVCVAPDGKHAVFAGVLIDKLEGSPPTRICILNLDEGQTRVLTFGPNTDRLPKYSPDGRSIAFLSDRHKAGDFQLYLLDPQSGAAHRAATVDGWIEYFHWSPNGRRIVLAVAGHGADVSGGQGAVSSKQVSGDVPSWMPNVETGDESFRWRRAWIYEFSTGKLRLASSPDCNIWEVSWCGDDALVAIASPGPSESLWYEAQLHLIDIQTAQWRRIFQPRDQIGWPAASPSGKYVAVVEAVCSDRWFVAGDLRLIETASGQLEQIATGGIDITYAEWRSEHILLLAGHRGFETVVALWDAVSGFKELWASDEITGAGGFYAAVSGIDEAGDCVLAGRGFRRAPEIGVIRDGQYRTVKSFDLGYTAHVGAIEAIDRWTWQAADGLEIQGWLLRPSASRPLPLVMVVHGGPVGHTRPMWLPAYVLMLLKRGYAVFFPNPRGSSGRGQHFARRVFGDMGGADAQDLLAGLDSLVTRGIVDPGRIGVMGASYGGFMTSWLITQDTRFAAAIPVAPHTNQVTEHLIGNLPHFMQMITKDQWNNSHGAYFARSPIMHAHKAKTPTLNIAGALDRCTPAEEAVQFHNALLEHGVKSILVIYPEEGHGIRKWPAVIDYTARVVNWFCEHMPAEA